MKLIKYVIFLFEELNLSREKGQENLPKIDDLFL